MWSVNALARRETFTLPQRFGQHTEGRYVLMGQDPNQPYPGQYGQPGGVPPQPSEYQQPSAYPPPNPEYQQPAPGAPGYQPNPGYPPAPGYQPNPGYQYQQQTYGQQGPLYNTANPNGPTSINMEPNVAAGLSYLTWIGGLVFFLIEKQNRFVRFNAMQSILLNAVLIVADIILNFIPFIGGLLVSLVGIAAFILWLICIINAFQGKYFKLPIIGDYAERWANPGAPGMPMR
jgi:uncharacterized membrane protein